MHWDVLLVCVCCRKPRGVALLSGSHEVLPHLSVLLLCCAVLHIIVSCAREWASLAAVLSYELHHNTQTYTHVMPVAGVVCSCTCSCTCCSAFLGPCTGCSIDVMVQVQACVHALEGYGSLLALVLAPSWLIHTIRLGSWTSYSLTSHPAVLRVACFSHTPAHPYHHHG